MFHFLHHWFVPHCELCRQEKLEERECRNCEILKQLLDTEKFENKRLLDRILHVPIAVEQGGTEEIKPIQPKTITSLRVRREMLEAEDRVRNKKSMEKEIELAPKTTEQLETELLQENR